MPQTNVKEAQMRAKQLGVTVKESTRRHKKLDVFKNGLKVASIGDIRYSDYLQHKDKARRKLYKLRHDNDRHVKGTAGYYADQILW